MSDEQAFLPGLSQTEATTLVYLTNEPPLPITGVRLNVEMNEVQSPFLPGTFIQYAWDSTSLGYLKICPRLYQYVMLEGWASRDESVHLRFGSEYHKALEDYDRFKCQGLSHEDAIHETVLQTLQRTVNYSPDVTTRAGKYKSRQRLISLIVDYLDKYVADPAVTMILDNGVPAVELSFRFELDWGPKLIDNMDAVEQDGVLKETYNQPYLLSGHLDRVVSFNSELFVMDRKTSMTTISSHWFNQFLPNNQMTLYTLASQVILDAPVKGVIIDGAQILLEKPNHFERGFTYRTKDQIDEWVNDLGYWFSLAETFAENQYWPMNDTSCDKFGGCKFRGICSKSPHVRETWLKSEFDKLEPEARWNPLKPR